MSHSDSPAAAALRSAWEAIQDPLQNRSLGEAGAVRGIAVEGATVAVEIVLGYPALSLHESIAAELRQAAKAVDPALAVAPVFTLRVARHAPQGELVTPPQIRNLIAVASGKGGVGKSTTAVNLAAALKIEGARVGLLDADLYGPSIPTMLGLSGKPTSPDGKTIVPLEAFGMPAMSMGMLVERDTAMIWRGPMVSQGLQQMFSETAWPELDYLVVDLPPGTGDTQLTLAQKIPVAGALVVTTPQEIATLDARRAVKMFEKVGVPVLGIVENMAMHICSHCGHGEAIFGSGGATALAIEQGLEVLAQLPLDVAIREDADLGKPIVLARPDSQAALAYLELARRVAARLALRPKGRSIGLGPLIAT